MSSRARWLTVLVLLTFSTISAPLVAAPLLNWDPTATNSSGGGGSGAWDTSSWWNGTSDAPWVSNANAVIGGAAGTITLGTPISASGVTFSTSGYTISGANALTVAGNGITVSASGATTFSTNVALATSPFFSVASGGTLALNGDLTRPAGTTIRFAGAGTTTLNTVNGTAASTLVTSNNGILGGWAIVDNGNSTYSWATLTGNAVSALAVSNTTPTPAPADNWAPQAAVTLASDSSAYSLIERADIHLAGHTLTIGSGGLIFQSANFWMQDSTGTLTSGAPGGELFVHTPNTTLGDTELRVNVTNNGATAVSLIKDGPGRLIMQSQNALGNTYTGNTIVNGGILELRNGVGATGELGKSPNIIVNAGATLALNAADVLGYTTNGNQAMVINSGGTVSNITAGSRDTIANLITMTGGVLTGTGTGDVNGQYSFFNSVAGTAVGINATSDAFGNPSIISARISPQTGNLPLNVTRGPANPAYDLNITLPILANGANGITKSGNGILLLSAVNTFNGTTTVSAGTVALGPAGTLGNGGATMAGGILDVSAYGSGGYTLSSGVLTGGRTSSLATDVNGSINIVNAAVGASGTNATLTINGNLAMSGGSLNYNLGDIVALPAGSLTLGGTDYFVPQVILTPGTYNLFTYNSGSPITSNLVPAGANFGARQAAVFSASAGTVSVAVTGSAATLLWRGGTWDNQISTTSWFNTGTASLDKFYNGDFVTFDDTAGAANNTVTIAGLVQPGANGLTVSNTAVNYIFGGTGTIAGGTTLAKNGPGSLTINNSNTYTGGTSLNGGLLVLGNSAAIGTGRLTITGGSLDCSIVGGGTLASNVAESWNGDFTFVGTQKLDMGTGAITLGSNRIVNVSSGSLTLRGAISDSGSGYSLNKAGAGTLILGGVNTYLGNTTVNSGTLQLNTGNGGNGALASPVVTANAGGFLALNAGDVLGYTASREAMVINGGIISNITAAARITVGNTITMTGGTLGGTGIGDANGCYSIFSPSGGTLITAFVATSDASGNPAVVNAPSFSLQTSNATYGFVVNRGTANPPADMIISSAIRPFGTAMDVDKSGNGILRLTGVNTYSGSASVSGGTMQLGDGTSGHDGSFTAITNMTNNASLVYNLFGAQSATYQISGTGNLAKAGPGQLTFAGNNNYTGNTTVSGGTLNLNGGDTSASMSVSGGGALYVNTTSPATSVSVASGAIFGGTGSLTSATAAVANGGTLDYSQVSTTSVFLGGVNYAGASGLKLGSLTNFTFSPVLNAGAMSTAGSIRIDANQGSVSVLSGTYDLLNYSTIAGTGTSAFQLGSIAGLGTRQTAALVNVPGQVELVVNGFTPYWGGNQPDWLTTNAWSLQPGGTLTSFQVGDADVFDDSASTGSVGGVVSLNSANVAPGSVTFSNVGLSYTVSGNFGITGTAALSIQGGGSVTILNSNSYTGGTSLSNGSQLFIGNGGATGSLPAVGAITVNSNSLLTFARSNTAVQGVDFGSPINGAGNLVQNGPGALIFTANNGYLGSTGINGGTLQLGTGASGQDGALTATSGVTNNGTLSYNLFGSQTTAYSIGGGGNVYKTGPGMLTMTASNSYIGGTTVNGGTLMLTGGNTGAGQIIGTLTINPSGAVVLGQHDVFGYSNASTTLTAININGGLLDKAINTGVNETLTGVTVTMTGGTWAGTGGYFDMFYNNYGDPNDSINTVANNSTALISAQINFRSVNTIFNVASGTTPSGIDLLVSGQLTGGFGLIKQGPGVMTITNSNNTYTGATNINTGTLQLGDTTPGHDGLLVSTSAVVNNGNFVFAIAGSQTAAYPISGSGSLFMTGTGTVVLSASDTYTGSTTVNAGRLYANGPLTASVVTVNGGLFGGRGSAPGASVATGGSIEGGYLGVGTLSLGNLAYNGSGTFTTNGYSSYPGFASAAPLNVTASNGLTLAGSPVVVNLGGQAAGVSGTYHLIKYSGSIGGSGFPAFVLGSTGANTPRGQVSGFSLANDPGYVDVSVTVTPVVWTGSLSTAWDANDTLAGPGNWSYSGGTTNFQLGDDVLFDNSTVSGGTVTISNGSVLPGGVSINNDASHNFTLTGLNGIGGSTILVKNGAGSLVINNSNGYTGGTNLFGGRLVLNNNSAIGAGALTISSGTLDSTVASISLPNNVQNWNGNFTFNGSQGLNMGTGAVTLGSSVSVNVSAGTMQVGGIIADGGNGFGLSKAGPGAMTLLSPNTYTGGTTVNGGTLNLAYGNGGIGTLRDGLTINPGATVVCTVNNALGYNNINWVQNITINNGALLTAVANSDNGWGETINMTGGTVGSTVANGEFAYGTYNAALPPTFNILASNTPSVISANMINRGETTNPGIVFNVARGSAANDLIVSGNIVSVNGSTGIFQNGNGIMVLTGTNTYTSTTGINGGTLQLGTGLAGQDGSIAGTSGVADNSAFAFNIAGTQTAAYTISGTGSVAMEGPGMTILSGTNSYTGGTFVVNGELQATNPSAIPDNTNLYVGNWPGLNSLGYPAPVVPTAAIPAATVSAVPEPGTLAMLAVVGTISATLTVRRRRRAVAGKKA